MEKLLCMYHRHSNNLLNNLLNLNIKCNATLLHDNVSKNVACMPLGPLLLPGNIVSGGPRIFEQSERVVASVIVLFLFLISRLNDPKEGVASHPIHPPGSAPDSAA